MSRAEDEPTTHKRDTALIPSILTNSANEVLEYFGEDIVSIRAAASVNITNTDELISTHGLIRNTTTQQKVELNYERVIDSEGVTQNPMTQDNVERIQRKLRSKLDDPDVDADPDMSVSKLTVDLVCPEITEVSRSQTDEYELTFISDAVQVDRERVRTERKNDEKNLFTELSFNFRNLNLRSVVETQAKYAGQSDGKIWGWGGVRDIRPNAPEEVSQAIKKHALPDDLGTTKTYEISEENRMKLVRMRDTVEDDNE
jgi:hypothetical protein